MSPDVLNSLFAIPGHLAFEAGKGGLTRAVVDNPYARCELYLLGAHVTSFAPRGEGERLWLSETAQFAPGRAIRGGVPLCWPWFGPDPEGAGRAQHGFARTSEWTLFGTSVNGAGETVLRLGLQESDATLKLWPHAFMLEYRVSVGRELTLELITENRSEHPMKLSAALHTYFAVDAIDSVRVEGLEGCAYADKLENGARRVQEGVLRIGSECDRIYDDAAASLILTDGTRRVRIAKTGSRSTVVWNPWRERAAAMGDFDDEGYTRMLCIETANAQDDTRTLATGERHVLTQRIGPA